MPIDRLDFDNLSEADLSELIAGQVPEGLYIDYKRELYGNSDSDKRELLKDVSGFANAFGGHLIVGMEEHNGIPIATTGITAVNPDDVILKYEQTIRTGLDPRIQGLRIRAVTLPDGSFCLVIRIPRSWHPPHRVSAQNSNRFWIRNSGGSHEASVDELRTLFTMGGDALKRVFHFRDERLQEITSGHNLRGLQGNGRLIIHILPLASVTSSWQIDLAQAYELHNAFRPIGSNTGYSPCFNIEGFINERGGEQNFGYTQVFRNGAIEATKAAIIRDNNGDKFIHRATFEQQIFEVLPSHINGLRNLGVPPPLVILITLEGVRGIYYKIGLDHFDEPHNVIERNTVYLPECIINEYGTEPYLHKSVKPAFDALWNSCGHATARSFSSDGTWRGIVS